MIHFYLSNFLKISCLYNADGSVKAPSNESNDIYCVVGYIIDKPVRISMEKMPNDSVNVTWEFLLHQQNNVSLRVQFQCSAKDAEPVIDRFQYESIGERYICVIEQVKLDFAKQWSSSSELTWRVIGKMDSDEHGQMERTFLLYKVNREILMRFIEVMKLYLIRNLNYFCSESNFESTDTIEEA